MISINGVTKRYGQQVLFEDASFLIQEKEKIACIGPNGAGKTTFFNIVAGEEESDHGEIHQNKKLRLGYFRQEWNPNLNWTVHEGALGSFQKWSEVYERLQQAQRRISENPHEASLLTEYADLEAEFQSLGGYRIEQRAKEILEGLGFSQEQFSQKLSSLSGGWRMRCQLAGLLLSEPDVLLLDEPTNHLDIETVVWFENFLKEYPNTVLFISHDHAFVSRLASSVLEFSPPRLTYWPVSYEKFYRERDTLIEQFEKEIEQKQKEVERLQGFVDRFRAKATKARQAQNRLKTADHFREQLAKLKASMPRVSKRTTHFRLSVDRRLPKVLLRFENPKFGYTSSKTLFGFDDWKVESGRKIGVVGANGVGKTTFLKTCAGELALLDGIRKVGEQIRIGYFAQHRMEELPASMKAYDYLIESRDDVTPKEVRSIAANLGLSENDLDKKIEVLSGGEKARVSLSRILLEKPDLLLLDEPTNHLDLDACKSLQQGLKHYNGTVIAVSHNRDFLDELVEFILEIRNHEAIVHHGNYSDWIQRRRGIMTSPVDTKASREAIKQSMEMDGKSKRRLEAEIRTENYQRRQIWKKMNLRLEEEIHELEKRKVDLEKLLCDPESPKKPEFADWVREQQRVSSRLELKETEWLKHQEERED